jgi:hypothetical protein
VTCSVVFACDKSLAAPPTIRFQAHNAFPELSALVTNTTDFTDAGQSVAAPVAHDI